MTSIVVRPGIDSTHDISLSNGIETFGFNIGSIQEVPVTPSTSIWGRAGEKFGSWEPGLSHIEQRDWSGGKGQEDFSEDGTRFFDSMNAWTVTSGKVMPAPQWKIATGLRKEDRYLPGNVTWKGLIGAGRYIDVSFTASASYSADKAYLWIRRVGTPGTLTVELRSDSAGSPGTVLKSKTVTITTVTDVVSLFYGFNWDTTYSIVSGTVYHIVVYGDAADNLASHWEVAVDRDTGGSYYSTDGTSWIAGTYKLYYRVVDNAPIDRYIHEFMLGEQMYVVCPNDAKTASVLYSVSGGALTALTTTGDTLGLVTGLCVANDIAIMAQGPSTNIIKFRKNGTAYELDYDGSNKADVVCAGMDATDGLVIFKATNSDVNVSRAKMTAWGTDMSFTKPAACGSTSYPISQMVYYDNKCYARKRDSMWGYDDGKARPMDVGLDACVDLYDYNGLAVQNMALYFSWNNSYERLYGSALDDVGPWKLPVPKNRRGPVRFLLPVMGWMFASVSNPIGYSTLLLNNGMGFHEIFRSWDAPQKMYTLFWQPIKDSNPVLWINVGGELVYMTFPRDTTDPEMDDGMAYQHEAVVVSSTIDMAHAELAKYFKELALISRNLGVHASVNVEYQVDEKIGSDDWTGADAFYGTETLPINRGDVKAFRFRLRLQTDTATTPPIVRASVLKGFARTPFKRQWNVRIPVNSLATTRTGEQDKDPDKFYEFLRKSCERAMGLHMHCVYKNMDDVYVIVEPPSTLRKTIIRLQAWWTGDILVTLREA